MGLITVAAAVGVDPKFNPKKDLSPASPVKSDFLTLPFAKLAAT